MDTDTTSVSSAVDAVWTQKSQFLADTIATIQTNNRFQKYSSD
jgi:hypothetical protein